MRISLMADPWSATVPDMIDEAAFAGDVAAETYWIAQIWRMDSMTLIPSLAAAAGPRLSSARASSAAICAIPSRWRRRP